MNSPHPSSAPTLMLGSSAGLKDVHDPSAVPLDTLTYLFRADDARAERNANGLFFVFDTRPEGDRSDHVVIQQRTEHLRRLLHTVLPHFSLCTHSELEAEGFAEHVERVPDFAEVPDPSLRQYARLQTAQVRHMRSRSTGAFTKFGWILDRRSQQKPVGGEVHFDRLLPADLGVDVAYTAPGFPLHSRDGKAPYLLHRKDRDARICIPTCREDIDAEIQKIRPGISRLMQLTIAATASRIAGNHADLNSDLAHLPVLSHMKEPVTDSRAIDDLRAQLSTSLHHLLP